MNLKGKRIYSILNHKCPRCHEGDLFSSGPYDLKHFSDMPEKCPYCGQRYSLEISFYTGAMYVSYALQVALFTAVYIALRVLLNPAAEVYMATMIGSAVLLLPITLRLSRAIYINFFVSYDSKALHKHSH